MKQIILILFSIFNIYYIHSQNLILDWALSQRGTYPAFNSINFDQENNMILTSNLSGNLSQNGMSGIDLDPGTDTIFSYNIDSFQTYPNTRGVIQKLDSLNQFIWGATVPGRITCSTIDLNNDIYVAGYFIGQYDFDPTEDTLLFTALDNGVFVEATNIFISKFSSTGEFLWAKTIGCSKAQDRPSNIKIDQSNNVIINGTFGYVTLLIPPFGAPHIDSIDLDPGPNTFMTYSRGYQDIFIQKLSPNGDFIWGKSFGSNKNDKATALAISSMDEIYTGGNFSNSLNINPDISSGQFISAGSSVNGFIQKLDSNGIYISGTNIGSTGPDQVNTINLINDNEIIISGAFKGSVDFDPSTTTYSMTSFDNSEDVFVIKTDSTYQVEWGVSFGNELADFAKEVTIGENGDIYTAGIFNVSNNTNPPTPPTDFDPGPNEFNLISYGFEDSFIHSIDQNGNFNWVKHYGNSTFNERPTHLNTDNNGNLYATFVYSNSLILDSDTTIYAPGVNNLVLKFTDLCPDVQYIYDTIFACDSYTWVNGIEYSTSTSSIEYDVQSSNNCDSLKMFLNLTIHNSIEAIDQIEACDSFTWINNITYYGNNSTAEHIINGGSINGCDSLVKLNLIIDNGEITNNQHIIYYTQGELDYQWLDCNNNYEVIPGETNQHYFASQNGSYAVVTSINGDCVDTSECLIFESFSNEELNSVNSIVIRSSAHQLSISSQNTTKGSIFNLNGQLLKSFDLIDEKSTIEFNQPPGIYFLQALYTNGVYTTHKFIKTQ